MSCSGRLTAWRIMITVTPELGIPAAPIAMARQIKLQNKI